MSFGEVLVLSVLGIIGIIYVVALVRQGWCGSKMIRRAEAKGVVWHHNRNNGSLALCKARDFEKELNILFEEAEEGKRKFHEKVLVLVSPAFTFWLEIGKQNFAQVGSWEDAEALYRELIELETGIKTSDVSNFAIKAAKNALVSEEPRLFVPFSGYNPEQAKKYGNTKMTLNEARLHLLQS